MHAAPPSPAKSMSLLIVGGVLLLLGAIGLSIWLSSSRMNDRLSRSTEEARLAQLQLDLVKLQSQVQNFAGTQGWSSVTAIRFEAERDAPGTLLPEGLPSPPHAVLDAGSPGRYELEVADTTGPRGIDHVLLLRGVTEAICRAYHARVGNAGDPLRPADHDPYLGGEGCTVLNPGGLTLFKTLSVQ